MNFEKAKNSYKKNAVIQKMMAKKLILLLINATCGNKFESIFEIGSGTGFLTDEIIKSLKFNNIILNDLTDNFTGFQPDEFIKGDINNIELKKNMSLIISNAVFQWISDHNLLFERLRKMQQKAGILCFSYFGKKNFMQIKDITGFGLEYPNLDEIIKNKGYKVLYFEEELHTLYFKDVYALLGHIKNTGVNVKNQLWTKKDILDFEKEYFKRHKGNLGIELTYHPLYYILEAI